MDILLATNNKHKLKEVRDKLAALGIRVFSPEEKGLILDVEETGSSFSENAALKSESLAADTGLPVIGDDSGLSVDCLNGKPGIYSSRFAGENASDQDNIDKLLVEMTDVPSGKRTCAFVCVMAFTYLGKTLFFEGRCPGEILTSMQGEGGFGYDPVFYLPQLKKTMAEITMEEKNRISHRGLALNEFVQYAENNF